VPHSEIANTLAGYDVFLFTSVWEEPIARSVMEAMASGLAVVGTAVGGQREMLEDGVNALVFPPEDANSLAECILRLRRDPDLRAKLAEAGRRTVLASFTLRRMMDETEAWLARIAEGED
jgi:phosphatidylinositol alpha 1,6-mannosyltransferase